MGKITAEKIGRRWYLKGDTFPVKAQLKDRGAKWDAEQRCWYTGKAEVAAEFDGQEVEVTGRWFKHGDQWAVKVAKAVAVGDTVTVIKSSGERQEVVVGTVVMSTDGEVCFLPQAKPKKAGGARRSSYRRRGTRTGCQCGSVEEFEKPSDCWTCRHDRD